MGKEVHNIHRDLIDRCLVGDTYAQKELYVAYKKAMFNTCLRIVKDFNDAEDILQDAFISAFRNLKSYKGDATFGAWLKRIVINKSINFLNKQKVDFVDLDREISLPEESEIQPDALTVKKVKGAIEKLPVGYRSVLSLYLFEGYDHSEIAAILSISESASKSQYSRAKNKVRELLNAIK
ncbi:MAG: RNA polymerase sigma factor [Bacteroidota bacterium]